MRKWLLFIFAITAMALAGFAQDRFSLLQDGNVKAAFVDPGNTSTAFKKNLEFFNGEFEKCTGKRLPVLTSPSRDSNHIIFALKSLPLAQEDAFSIDFPDSTTLRISGTDTSVRWALNHILEKELGIRWFFPPLNRIKAFRDKYGDEINHYPLLHSIYLERKKFSDEPAVKLQRAGCWRIAGFAQNWNGKTSLAGVHQIPLDVFPAAKYAPDNSWPEAILPVIKGKKMRLADAPDPLPGSPRDLARPYRAFWQPCWSNPDTTRIAIENILEILGKEPDRVSINMDVNDMGGYCECQQCLQVINGKRNISNYADYSELYWKWVHDVATAVCAKYPDVIFSAIAYCGVLSPPSFQLHSNVLPRLCIELPALLDDNVGPNKLALIQEWSQKASSLDLYDYMHGFNFFLIPRIYFRSHSKLVADMVQKYHLNAAYYESDGETAFQGPQQQLLIRLLWNPNLDVEKFLHEWYVDAVGEKAAPWLAKYFDFWEAYWTGQDIRKTSWYASVGNVYMHLGEIPTHTYALKKGDMKRLREFLEKVVELAETPGQKARALEMMKLFVFSEDACQALFSEIFQPDGTLTGADDALGLLQTIPQALAAAKRVVNSPYAALRKENIHRILPSAISSIGKIIPYLGDQRIQDELTKLLTMPELPIELVAQIRIWQGAKPENLIANGSLEEEGPLPRMLWNSIPGVRDSTYASDGKYAYKVNNTCLEFRHPVTPGKSYLFMCDLFIPKGSSEGRVSFKTGPQKEEKPLLWLSSKNNIPSGGIWNNYSQMVTIPEGGDSLVMHIYFQKFEPFEALWLDHVRLFCLDELGK